VTSSDKLKNEIIRVNTLCGSRATQLLEAEPNKPRHPGLPPMRYLTGQFGILEISQVKESQTKQALVLYFCAYKSFLVATFRFSHLACFLTRTLNIPKD